MKKLNKKLIYILSASVLAVAIAAVALVLIFTSGQNEEDIPEGVKASISFSTTEKSLIVGDEEYLFPTYQKLEGYVLTYESSDMSVVGVDNSGKISALKEGTAEVKAIYSNGTDRAEASITVSSSFGGYLPELKTMGISADVAICFNDSYQMIPYVVFNGKQFNDLTVSYRITNTEIAEVNQGGLITAKAIGQTQLVIEASWRGQNKATAPTMQKTVSLSVINDVRFYNGGETIANETLYTFAEFEGETYKNSLPCEFTAVVNGVESDAEFTIENQAVIRAEGDLLTVASFGSTNVIITKEVDGVTYSKTFTIVVERVQKTVLDTVPMFETVNGGYFDVAGDQRRNILHFVGDSDQVIDAYQDSTSLTVNEGKILGVQSSSQMQKGSAQISVGTDKIIYHFTVETVAQAISSRKDLKALELSDGKTLNGYYELLNDIDASGVSLNHVVTGNASFAGVFNGNGYSIKNLSLNENSSLFGVLKATAIVKNLALVNLNATKSYFIAQNTIDDGLTISDVYISLSPSTVTPRGLTGRTAQSSIYKNVVIEYLGENASENRNYQERWTWQGLIGGLWTYENNGVLYAQDKNWKDVYVISPFTVSFRSDEKKDGSNFAALYGYGKNETQDIYGNALGQSITYNRENPNLGNYWETTLYYNAWFTNLYHYSSYGELAAANCDFSTFSNDYWVVDNGKIAWKSLFVENLDVRFFDRQTDLGGDAKLVGVGKELKIKAFTGEEERDIEIEIEDNEYVKWNFLTQAIRLVKAPENGSVSVDIKVILELDNCKVEKTVSIMAVGELINVVNVYDLIDENTGKMAGNAFPMGEIIGSEAITSIYQGSNELTYDAEQGMLLGLTANIEGVGENRVVKPVEITINAGGKVYIVKLMVYSKVIVTAQDLQYFNQTAVGNENNTYDGYYILASNIVDYSTVYNVAPDNNSGLKAFTGTFDGNGHSVSVKLNKGLFGTLGNGAVVKNLAFTNTQVAVEDAYTVTAVVAGYINNSTDVAVVKDVYISMDSQNNPYRQYLSIWFTSAMLISNNASLQSKFANIVIEADIYHSDYNSKGGAQPCLFRYWNGIDESQKGGEYAKNTAIDSLTNVYVISKDKTGNGGLFRVTAGINRLMNKSMALSYNDFNVVAKGQDSYTTLYLPNTYNNGGKELITMRRYDDYSAMASDNNDYSLFNGNCWDITGTTPVWKNK